MTQNQSTNIIVRDYTIYGQPPTFQEYMSSDEYRNRREQLRHQQLDRMASYDDLHLSFEQFTSLPVELQLQIWNQLPNLWSVVALRMSCRRLNDFYKAHEQVIRRAQRDNLIDTITYWFKYVVKPHEHDLHCDEVIFDTTTTGWNIVETNKLLRQKMVEDDSDWDPRTGRDTDKQKTDFTLEIKDFLPYHKQGMIDNRIGPGVRVSDWRPRKQPRQARHHMEHYFDGKINTRHCVNLTGGRAFMVDTLHAWIYYQREEHEKILTFRWDLYKFVCLQIEWARSHPHLYLDRERVEPDSLEDSQVPLEEIQALRGVLARSEWPQHLDEATKSYIEQWWMKNKPAYDEIKPYGDQRPIDSYMKFLLRNADKSAVYPMESIEVRRRHVDYTFLYQPYCGMDPARFGLGDPSDVQPVPRL